MSVVTESSSTEAIVSDPHCPAVHTHLQMLQSIIQRMAANSAAAKSWCVAIVSAILVLAAREGKPDYTLLTLVPTLAFCIVDGAYLGLEREFRKSYERFVEKLHAKELKASDLFVMKPVSTSQTTTFAAVFSWSVYSFYGALVVMTLVCRFSVISPE